MCSELEKAVEEMRDKKETNDDVPGDVLILLGEDGLRIMAQPIYNIYETGEWTKDFTEVTMTALKNNTKVTKCSNHCTISLNTDRAKIAVRVLRKRTEMKTEDVLAEDLFGYRRGKGTRDANGMLRIISE